MRANLPQPSEAQIQADIIGYLRIKGYYVQRMNSGMLPMGEGRSKRLIRMNRAGTPDVMAFREAKHRELIENCPIDNLPGRTVTLAASVNKLDLLFIEVKRPGNKPTALQTEVMKELEEYGARCIVAHSVEEVEEAL